MEGRKKTSHGGWIAACQDPTAESLRKTADRKGRPLSRRQGFLLPAAFSVSSKEAVSLDANLRERAIAIDIGDTYLFAMISNAPLSRAVLVRNPLDRGSIDRARRSMQTDPEKFHSEVGRIAACVDFTCDLVLRKCVEWQVSSIAIGTRSIKNPFTIRPRALRDNPLLNLSLHLLGTLRFRCALARIDVHLVDERNTSRIDALGMEPVAGKKNHRRDQATGRLTRKEYHSTTGAAIHRDINAAINIGRLVFGDAFAEPILKSRQWEHPDVEFIELGREMEPLPPAPHVRLDPCEIEHLVSELAGLAREEARDAFLQGRLEEALGRFIQPDENAGGGQIDFGILTEEVPGLNTKRLRRYLKRRGDLAASAKEMGFVVSGRAKKILVEWDLQEEDTLRSEACALGFEAEKGGARALLSAALSLQSRSEARSKRRQAVEEKLTEEVQPGTTYRLEAPPALVRFIRARRDQYAFPDILEVMPAGVRPFLTETVVHKKLAVSG